MEFPNILKKYKEEIITEWVEAVFATYPLETTGFLRTKTDPFTNPVAHMTKEAAEVLFNALAGDDVEVADIKNSLDRFMKLRAVQKFAPSQNLSIFYLMKPILRKKILAETLEHNQLDAFLEMESKIDTLALLAFDLYANARETLAEARIGEIRKQHAQLAAWAQKLERQD